MASPQTSDGFTQIANELLEHLIYDTKVSVGELKLLLFVMRKTYGWGKKWDRISLSQFEKGIKYGRSNICRMLKKVVAKRLLLKSEKGYSINKNWEEWVVAKQPLPGGVVAKRSMGSGNLVNKVVAKQPPTKERKKLIQKKEGDPIEKFTQNPLWTVICAKYPDRDHLHQLKLMLDWWSSKGKKPQAISAFENWLKKSNADPELVNARVKANLKREQDERQRLIDATPPAKPESLAIWKKAKDKLSRKFGV